MCGAVGKDRHCQNVTVDGIFGYDWIARAPCAWRSASRRVIDVDLMLNSDRIISHLMMENWRALLLFKKTHGVTREQTVALRHGSLDAVA